MRRLVAVLAPCLLLLSGCLDGDTTGGAADAIGGVGADRMGLPPVNLTERYDGVLISAAAGPVVATPDQLGDNHREFYVHNGTLHLGLDLRATGGELRLRVEPPGCPSGCPVEVATQGGGARLVWEEPAEGIWKVTLDAASPGGGEIDYVLDVEKSQRERLPVEQEAYDGTVVAAHLVAIRISPDQLGHVYREFWVHEGTRNLTVDVEADDDLYIVLGQSDRGRDRESEEGWDTRDGRLNLTFEDPVPGGWYIIYFHPTEGGPNVQEVAYATLVTKRL